MIIDGYNVTKGTWPDRSLEQQRELLIAATEQLAARFGTHLIIVFDGADIAGAHRVNRSLIRVMYSPNGITADDVIREEVRRLPLQPTGCGHHRRPSNSTRRAQRRCKHRE